LKITEGERVIVQTETGQMAVTAAIAEIRAGNLAMYYPEANAIVPRRLDPQSKTPAFKSVKAKLIRIKEGVARRIPSPS
jgi:anaerobic selenocysteine-containing dehydrogenase